MYGVVSPVAGARAHGTVRPYPRIRVAIVGSCRAGSVEDGLSRPVRGTRARRLTHAELGSHRRPPSGRFPRRDEGKGMIAAACDRQPIIVAHDRRSTRCRAGEKGRSARETMRTACAGRLSTEIPEPSRFRRVRADIGNAGGRVGWWPGSGEVLLPPRPLRTARESFPSSSSSLHERPSRDAAALVRRSCTWICR